MTKYYSKSKGKFVDIATMPDQYVRNAFVKMCSEESNYKKLAEDNFVSSVADLDKIESLIKHNNKLQAMNDKLKDTTKDIIKEKDLAIFTLRSSLDHNISEYKQLTDTLRDKGMYEPYDNQGRVRDYQVEFTKVAKERDDYKKKANDMEMAKMSINRDLLDAKDKLKDTVSKQAYQVMWDNCEKLKEDYKYANDRMMNYATMLNNKYPKGDLKTFSEIPNTDDGWEFVDKLKHYLNKASYKLRVRGQYLDDETKKNGGWRKYERGQPIDKSKCLRVYIDLNKDVD